jgi:hypothetical protein
MGANLMPRGAAIALLAVCASGGCLAGGLGAADGTTTAPAGLRYGKPRFVCNLANRQVDESSGMACSRRSPGVFWTHNDSGDRARLFALDMKGRHLGTCTVLGALNRDWEDLASFSIAGKHYLLICDTGDNDRARTFVTLHLVEEPAIEPGRKPFEAKVRPVQTVHFTYDDGPQDCESVAVDPTTKTVYLVAKRGRRTVYELPLPNQVVAKALVAKSIGRLSIWQTTAMDISPDGLRAVVLTYLYAYEYRRRPGEKWADAFARPGRRLPTPGRRQGESICYGADGKTLYLTSEKLPTPLLEVPVVGGQGSPTTGPAKR